MVVLEFLRGLCENLDEKKRRRTEKMDAGVKQP